MAPEADVNRVIGHIILEGDVLRKKFLTGILNRKDLSGRGLSDEEMDKIERAAFHYGASGLDKETKIKKLGEELDRIRQGLSLSFEKPE